MTNKYSLKAQLLNEGPRFENGRARRQYVKNEIDTEVTGYDGRVEADRIQLAKDMYSLMTRQKQGFYSPGFKAPVGSEAVYTKRFKNGMVLKLYSACIKESTPHLRYKETFMMSPYAKGRVYFELSYQLPAGYAAKAGVEPLKFTFTSRPVNRTGTYGQIIARVNAGLTALEDYAEYIISAAAYFAKVAAGDEDAETAINQKTGKAAKMTMTVE